MLPHLKRGNVKGVTESRTNSVIENVGFKTMNVEMVAIYILMTLLNVEG